MEGKLQLRIQRYGWDKAAGDYEVLERRRRRVMRVHLGRDVEGALDSLVEAVEAAGVQLRARE